MRPWDCETVRLWVNLKQAKVCPKKMREEGKRPKEQAVNLMKTTNSQFWGSQQMKKTTPRSFKPKCFKIMRNRKNIGEERVQNDSGPTLHRPEHSFGRQWGNTCQAVSSIQRRDLKAKGKIKTFPPYTIWKNGSLAHQHPKEHWRALKQGKLGDT